jgi:hypothetical protein
MLALTLEVDTVGGKVTREIQRLQVAIKRHIALLMLPAAQKHNGHKSQRTQSTQRSRGSSGRGPRAGLDRSLATLWSIVIEVFVPHFRSERNRLQRAGLQVRSLGRRRIV